MKGYRRKRLSLGIIVICSILTAPLITSAQRDSGRLIIRRSPDLGNDVYVDVRIDGATAPGILYAQRFDRAIPAGRHLITVKLGPTAYHYTGSSLMLYVRPAMIYRFVAVKRGGALVLAAD